MVNKRTPFGIAIMGVLNESGLTQGEFAFDIGLSQSSISLIVNGQRTMPRHSAVKMLEKLPDYPDFWYEWLRDIEFGGLSKDRPLEYFRVLEKVVDFLVIVNSNELHSLEEFLERRKR